MLLYPAIDLMEGQVVRLEQGRADRKTVYADDPAAFARRWRAEGGDWLHVVDLDAAFTGVQRNLDAVRAIVAAAGIPVELGGGLRDVASVERALDAGVARAVIGTRAAEEPEFIAELAARFGGERIAVGIDAKDGFVAVRGWVETGTVPATDLAKRVEAAGARTIIYTDIATDGMLAGPNCEAMRAMLGATRCDLIASGGVGSDADVLALAKLPGLHGAIIGRALYENRASLRAIRRALGRAEPS